jgi:hypothetical protein
MKTKRAPLIADIPAARVHSKDGSVPRVGDVVELDQGFTFPDGKPGCLVYCKDHQGKYKWGAEVYESEIGDDIDT